MDLKDKKYIKLYAEDFDTDVWESYCNVAKVPLSATSITIFFDPKEVEYGEEEESDCDLPKEITVTLDDLSLEYIHDEEEVTDAISDYLSDTYGFCHSSFEWEHGDDVDTINIYNIDWDTSDNEENDDDDGNYLIVEEDGTKHYYDDEPDVDVIHGFVVGMCVDITVYKRTEDGGWEATDRYHA